MKKLIMMVALLAAPGAAEAFSSVPGHASIDVKPIKGPGGRTVGCKLTFCVRDPNGGYKFSHPSLLTPQNVQALRSSQDRASAIDPSRGFIRLQLPTVSVPNQNVVQNVSHEIHYGVGNDLKAGEELELVTAWTADGNGKNAGPHVYGTITQSDPANKLTLPH